jgi:short-subunit dehydrogenase
VNDEALPTAIVTGSAKGIGKATAELLAIEVNLIGTFLFCKTVLRIR